MEAGMYFSSFPTSTANCERNSKFLFRTRNNESERYGRLNTFGIERAAQLKLPGVSLIAGLKLIFITLPDLTRKVPSSVDEGWVILRIAMTAESAILTNAT